MSRVSIFIWKSDEADKKADPSWSSIRHHRGTDWFREDRGLEGSQSYRLLLQGKLAVNEVDDGIWFIAEQMPSHWMGREQFTSADILYQLILQEGGWVWDRLGIWNRCMRPDTGKTMEEQWKEVSLWREGESIPIVIPVSDPTPVPVLQNRHYYESTKQKHNRGRGNSRNRGISSNGGWK